MPAQVDFDLFETLSEKDEFLTYWQKRLDELLLIQKQSEEKTRSLKQEFVQELLAIQKNNEKRLSQLIADVEQTTTLQKNTTFEIKEKNLSLSERLRKIDQHRSKRWPIFLRSLSYFGSGFMGMAFFNSLYTDNYLQMGSLIALTLLLSMIAAVLTSNNDEPEK